MAGRRRYLVNFSTMVQVSLMYFLCFSLILLSDERFENQGRSEGGPGVSVTPPL